MAQDNFDDVQQSLGRCLRRTGFVARFYEYFMDSHPSFRGMFAHTDMGRQRKALRRGISVALAHAGGSGIVKRSMDEMAQVHSRNGHAPVKPELYDFWVDALVRAVTETDPRITPELEERWRTAMNTAVDHFKKHY